MTALKTTRWFSSLRRQPSVSGVYEVETGFEGLRWSWFDGAHWNGAWTTKQEAEQRKNWFEVIGFQGACSKPFMWRGLKEQA